jgi:hypothetical protein
MAMPIERRNSFHLLLSDDELTLLKLLAEQEGLNASDYLRTTLRRAASTPPHLKQAIRVSELMGVDTDFSRFAKAHAAARKAQKSARGKAKKK